MQNKTTQTLLIAAAIAIGPLVAFAWTAAPSSPPNGNVTAPLNVGGTYQHKTGELQVGVLGVDGGALISGNVGIGTLSPQSALQVGDAGDGSAVLSNIFLYISDATLKKNVVTLPDALSKILKLRGVSFNWKSNNAKSIGLIAQEVEKVYPEFVNTDSKGIKSVQEGNLVAPLIEAVKAQQKQIEELRARILTLEARLK
ncbi:MAG: tail fiber domain-containing protein [Candidatus Taylorbacteria bacterium]|nr:tail fiber domain-containing protein [Candidatus Taylorbacteria bacterium]